MTGARRLGYCGAIAGLAFSGLLTGHAGALQGQEWTEFRSARQAHSVSESFSLELVYGAGELTIEPSDADLLYDLRMTYDSEKFKPVRNWELKDGRGDLTVGLTTVGDSGEWIEALTSGDLASNTDLSFDLGDLRDLDKSAGTLDLRLGRQLPIDLKIAAGAAKSEVELGGVALSRLEFSTAASETELSFEKPNPVEMVELVIRAGAAEIRTENLGNARFESFELRGGVGDVVLDFGGEWSRDATGTVKMGVGSLKLKLPTELGVWIRKSSFLTSFSAPGFDKVDDGFRSPNWESAEHHLELRLETAFGAIEVDLVP